MKVAAYVGALCHALADRSARSWLGLRPDRALRRPPPPTRLPTGRPSLDARPHAGRGRARGPRRAASATRRARTDGRRAGRPPRNCARPFCRRSPGSRSTAHEWGSFRIARRQPGSGGIGPSGTIVGKLPHNLRHVLVRHQRVAVDLRLRSDLREVRRREGHGRSAALRGAGHAPATSSRRCGRRTSPRARTRSSSTSPQETLDNQQKHLVQVQAFVQVGDAARDRARPAEGRRREREGAAHRARRTTTTRRRRSSTRRPASSAAPTYDVDRRAGAAGRRRGAAPRDARREGVRGAPRARQPVEAGGRRSTRPSARPRAATGPRSRRRAARARSAVLPNAPSPNSNVGVTLTWPLFQGGLTKAHGARRPRRTSTSITRDARSARACRSSSA